MIVRYAHVRQRPAVFQSVTGLRVAEFDALLDDLLPRLRDAEVARLSRPLRRRAADPIVQRLLAEGRRNFEAGRGLDPEQLYAEIGYVPPSRRPTGRRPAESTARGKLQLRLPQSVHRDVIARAAAGGVSVNQLLVSYVGRGLGQDHGARRVTAHP